MAIMVAAARETVVVIISVVITPVYMMNPVIPVPVSVIWPWSRPVHIMPVYWPGT